jgi:hypothetical protein
VLIVIAALAYYLEKRYWDTSSTQNVAIIVDILMIFFVIFGASFGAGFGAAIGRAIDQSIARRAGSGK